MNILIINCHWDNRGDEAAIRSMTDSLACLFPNVDILVQRALGRFESFPEKGRVRVIPTFLSRKSIIPDMVALLSNGRICMRNSSRIFYDALRDSLIVIHAPGGPSIGDLYPKTEPFKLLRLIAVLRSGVPYAFYAPSMGPFHNRFRNIFRKPVLRRAELICLREGLSQKMLEEFLPGIESYVTLDSAFQKDINYDENERLFQSYGQLREFVGNGSNVIGITVTDLRWNASYRDDGRTAKRIREAFTSFISFLTLKKFKVLFIPQLFESSNDYDYMQTYVTDDCFVMSDEYDCFFQQHVIGKLAAVVGMRYHSNIFSAKMGTPFISVSYEQKMRGFMEREGLDRYCLDIEELSFEELQGRFENLVSEYDMYKEMLRSKKGEFKRESYRTTELVSAIIEQQLEQGRRS